MKDTLDIYETALLLELGHAFNRNDWTPSEIKKLSQGDLLAKVRLLLNGCAKLNVVKHVIDLTADPFIPDGLKVEHHEKGVVDFEWNPTKVRLHLSKNQKGDKSIEGKKLRKELANEAPLNANLLDFLLKNPCLIPKEWKADEAGKTRCIYFWGTIYRDSVGRLYVRYLYWSGGKWGWHWHWLIRYCSSQCAAACLAK